MNKMDDHELKVTAVKMTVAGGGAVIYTYTLQEWVAILTIVYVLLQIGLLLPKYWNVGKDSWPRFIAFIKKIFPFLKAKKNGRKSK